MRKDFMVMGLAVLLMFFAVGISSAKDKNIYYARCNLKVIKGSYITWVNWQAARTMVPVGTKFRVSYAGTKATLEDVKTGKTYTLDLGAEGEVYLKKFVTKKKISIKKFPENVQAWIRKGFAKIGMTKEQAYIAMGPPSWAGGRTDTMTYEDIMAENLWVYKRKRFAKNIGVEFNPATGRVTRTEGIWGR